MSTPSQISARFRQFQDRLVLQASDLSLATIAQMVEAQSIDVAPEYQRRERWSSDKQSALIESFLLNVPVPPVYLAEEDFGRYSVIDGKQRITVIHAFMRDRLKLEKLEEFTELEGFNFSALPRDLQNALSVRPYLRAVTLLKQSESSLKYEVFTRLNRGGEPLIPQEIRNVLFRGDVNNMVMLLGENVFLRRQLKITGHKSPAFRMMADAELVLRFFTLCETWQDFSGDYRRSMDEFMRNHRGATAHEIQRLRSSFEEAMSLCERTWGDKAFKRPGAGSSWRNQFLAGMYDAQMVAVTLLNDAQQRRLVAHGGEAIRITRDLFRDGAFESAVRQGTNTPSRVQYRISKMVDALRGL